MNPSLSLILPMRNASETLAAQVYSLLETLPDLTSDFEIVLVDDGSTDSTDELAAELAREFPQVKSVRHGLPRGTNEAIDSGLRAAAGEVVLIFPAGKKISHSDLRRAWQYREVRKRPAELPKPRPVSAALLDRLRSWGVSAREKLAAAPRRYGSPVVRRWKESEHPAAAMRTIVNVNPEGELEMASQGDLAGHKR